LEYSSEERSGSGAGRFNIIFLNGIFVVVSLMPKKYAFNLLQAVYARFLQGEFSNILSTQ
jgi:hypothetical protein